MKLRSMLPSLWNEPPGGLSPFRELQGEIDRLFENFSKSAPMMASWGKDRMMPVKVDVAETDRSIEVNAELPGVEGKDIDVTISDDILTIKAEKRAEKEDTSKDYHVVERSYGKFERSMRLPFHGDTTKVDAHFDKGVLKLVIEKPAAEQSKLRKIEVKSAA